MTREELVSDGLMTPNEAFAWLGIKKSKGYDLMAKGLLPYVKLGHARRIPRRALLEFAAQHLVGEGFV